MEKQGCIREARVPCSRESGSEESERGQEHELQKKKPRAKWSRPKTMQHDERSSPRSATGLSDILGALYLKAYGILVF